VIHIITAVLFIRFEQTKALEAKKERYRQLMKKAEKRLRKLHAQGRSRMRKASGGGLPGVGGSVSGNGQDDELGDGTQSRFFRSLANLIPVSLRHPSMIPTTPGRGNALTPGGTLVRPTTPATPGLGGQLQLMPPTTPAITPGGSLPSSGGGSIGARVGDSPQLVASPMPLSSPMMINTNDPMSVAAPTIAAPPVRERPAAPRLAALRGRVVAPEIARAPSDGTYQRLAAAEVKKSIEDQVRDDMSMAEFRQLMINPPVPPSALSPDSGEGSLASSAAPTPVAAAIHNNHDIGIAHGPPADPDDENWAPVRGRLSASPSLDSLDSAEENDPAAAAGAPVPDNNNNNTALPLSDPNNDNNSNKNMETTGATIAQPPSPLLGSTPTAVSGPRRRPASQRSISDSSFSSPASLSRHSSEIERNCCYQWQQLADSIRCCGCWSSVRRGITMMVNSKHWPLFWCLVILANSLVLSGQYYDQDDGVADSLSAVNDVFIAAFTFEMVSYFSVLPLSHASKVKYCLVSLCPIGMRIIQ
jgi:hypothetical protein